ncbi:MAG: PAS domain S-box protein [Rhodocyclaceae bacterium]
MKLHDQPVSILIVEDDAAHAEAVVRALQGAGWSHVVRLVGSLQACREEIARATPDIVLADLNLVDGRALDLLGDSAETRPYPVLVMTSHGDQHMAVQAMKAGASEYLVKSERTFAETPRLVERALNQWRLVQDRRHAQKALRESEAMLRAIIANTPNVAIRGHDLEGRVVFWNRAGETLFGWSEAEAVARTLDELGMLSERNAAEFLISLRQIADTGLPVGPKEWTLSRRDGQLIQCQSTQFEVNPAEGQRTIVCMDVDVTERNRALTALHESEERLNSIWQSLTDIVSIHDSDHVFRYITPSAARILGYPTETLVGSSPYDYVHPEDMAPMREIFGRVVDRTNPGIPFGFRFRHRNGHDVYLEALGRNLMDKPGVRGIMIVSRDVTERKQAEAATRDAESRFRNLLEHIPAITYIAAARHRSSDLYISPQIQPLLGFTADEWCADPTTWVRQVHEDDRERVLAQLEQCEAEGQPFRCDYRMLSRDGLVRWFRDEAEFVRVGDDKPAYLQGVMLDITERHRAEEEVQRLNNILEARVADRTQELALANRELESFAYSVSHDLRAPLRAIDGFSLLLLREYANKLDDQGSDYLNRVRRGVQRMGQLIDDLLNLSRVTRAQMKKEPVNLSAIAEAIVHELKDGESRQVDFVVAPGLVADADPDLMRIALTNLLDNAWKFTGKQVLAHIEFGCAVESEGRVFFVRDDGAGFDPKYIHKLFHAFERLHNPSDFEGNGIGLATVQRIVARHGGRIWAEGGIDQGACFYFTIP